MKDGGTAIPYNEEDPFLRKEFEETLVSVGTKSRMEPELYETISFRPRQSLHWVPVGLVLVLYMIYHCLNAWRIWRNTRAARA